MCLIFHRDKDDGLTSRMLTAEDAMSSKYKPKVPYEITVYTGDQPSAGTGMFDITVIKIVR